MRIRVPAILGGFVLAATAGSLCHAGDSAPFPPYSSQAPDLPPRPEPDPSRFPPPTSAGSSSYGTTSPGTVPSSSASSSTGASSTSGTGQAKPPFPPPPPIAEETALPLLGPPKCCLGWLNPFAYIKYTVNHGARERHHGRNWFYIEEQLHGFPYGCSPYEGRAAGASYTFGQWGPRRSFYYAYQPGGYSDLPYGFSAEPYYNPKP